MKLLSTKFFMMVGCLLLLSSPLFAQNSATTQDTVLLTEEVDVEKAKRNYNQKAKQRAQARADARAAKAAAKEAKYQEMEAFEAAKIAERMAKLEEKAIRREERKAARRAQRAEATAK
ncbi:hypothetical protein [Rufibacter roseus]|uniref:Uncharacterized protein n=1 Tax=Rufibacter roseus TaxID=1567108 RepID=A0ABW2DSZ0_9BACT|nr:hypothetical protein [Rufibacter roseus]